MQALVILYRSQMGPEHHVEVTRLGPLALGAAVGAGNVLESLGRIVSMLFDVCLFEGIGPVTLVAVQALDQGVVEYGDMTRGLPDGRGQNDRGIDADHVASGDHHGPPPLTLDVVLEGNTQGTIVPCRPGPSVDLPRGEDEPPALGQGDDLIQFRDCH